MEKIHRGAFTLPGEAGYERLTLELAKRWGADAIRDSDGTRLSKQITEESYDIYSTICLVRSDNAWARANPDKLQQNFLMSFPKTAQSGELKIDLLSGYSRDQFSLNIDQESKGLWQVFDRTRGKEIGPAFWNFEEKSQSVIINKTEKNHCYTVNFLARRIWEAISMYNHISNNWGDKDRLMPVDPIYPETRKHILDYLKKWLDDHPKTDVVRFTSMFYNFAWFWGDKPELPYIYSDWGSYDFTVSPFALDLFEREKGYRLCSEDFVNQGRFNSTHNPPDKKYLDWIDFINNFVTSFCKECVELVHKSGRKAFLFYDDHWLGTEPYSKRFQDLKMDGIIKCVFNGFEARMCANVEGTIVHELRLHPYLFPIGLNGGPTFKKGGHPEIDAKRYWANVRRALIIQHVDRIGLGGYLHLVEDFPEFIDTVEELTNEFRAIKKLHKETRLVKTGIKVGVLTAWGSLRSWICSGHLHEHPEIYLTNVLESLSGLPVDVVFLSFGDILEHGIPEDIHIIVNAGTAGDAWSGGGNWSDPEIVSRISEWVADGGGFIGIGEPSALNEGFGYFKLRGVLGVDREIGQTVCLHKIKPAPPAADHFIVKDWPAEQPLGSEVGGVYAIDNETIVLGQSRDSVNIAVKEYGKGRSVYFSGYVYSAANTRLLFRSLFWAAKSEDIYFSWNTSDIYTECNYFNDKKIIVVTNNGDKPRQTTIFPEKNRKRNLELIPFEIKTIAN